MKKLSLRILWKRLCLESPSFFKRVKRIAASFAALCTAVTLAYGEELPAWLGKVVEYGIVAGVVSIAIAQFTVENPEDLHKPNECGK